jgi:signal peptidase II
MIIKKTIILFLITIFIIFSDLGSKSFVKNIFQENEQAILNQSIEILPFLSIKNLCNNGVSFGIFGNLSTQVVQIIISIIFIILLIYSFFLIKSQQINLYGNFMIIGGAIANLIDRFLNGCVYDFIDFHFKNIHFYVFNIADSFIVIGAMLILFIDNKKIKLK